MMNPAQIEQLRAGLGIAEGAEWEPWGGLGDNAAAQLQAFVENRPLARPAPEPVAPAVAVPDRLPVPDGAEQSTQAARSEEHTSELQSLMRISYAGFCLKNKQTHRDLHPPLIHTCD